MSKKRRPQAVAPSGSPLPAPTSPPGANAGRAQHDTPHVEPRSKGPYIAVATAVAIVALAWWGAGALTRRAQGAMLPALADLSGLPAPARQHIEEALAVGVREAGMLTRAATIAEAQGDLQAARGYAAQALALNRHASTATSAEKILARVGAR